MEKIKAFTLVELLVTIAIIGLIIAVTVVNINESFRSGRDTRRVADITQIQNALVSYYIAEHQYPASLTFGGSLVGSTSSTTYMQIIPQNPTPRNDGDCLDAEYGYYPSNDRRDYQLSFCLGGKITTLPAGCHIATAQGIGAPSDPNSACIFPEHLSGLTLWLKSDSGVIENGNTVSEWDDQSGNNHNLLQATASYQPTLTADPKLNNSPVLTFDGVDDYLKSNPFPFGQPETIFLVIDNNNPASNDYIIDGSHDWSMSIANYGSNIGIYTNGSPDGWSCLVPVLMNAPQVIIAGFNGASSTLEINNYPNSCSLSIVVADGFTLAKPGDWPNGDNNSNIKVAEILAYNRVLTADEKNLIQNYLKKRYKLNY